MNDSDLISISKYLALILRHRPDIINIKLDYHGWANVDEIIAGIKLKYPQFNKDILKLIVHTDKKQRYLFSRDGLFIRANQGHSVNVDVELIENIPPQYLYHGSDEKYLASIKKLGLISKQRLYVHLSSDYNTAFNVGKRHGNNTVVFIILAKEMYHDNYKFYLSKNNVWLTKKVPIKYLLNL